MYDLTPSGYNYHIIVSIDGSIYHFPGLIVNLMMCWDPCQECGQIRLNFMTDPYSNVH